MPETKTVADVSAPVYDAKKVEERIYNLLRTLTPHIGKKFMDVSVIKLTDNDVLAEAVKNPDILTDSSGNITVMALLQSIVAVATGKRLKGLRHPVNPIFQGFRLEDHSPIQAKSNLPKQK